MRKNFSLKKKKVFFYRNSYPFFNIRVLFLLWTATIIKPNAHISSSDLKNYFFIKKVSIFNS